MLKVIRQLRWELRVWAAGRRQERRLVAAYRSLPAARALALVEGAELMAAEKPLRLALMTPADVARRQSMLAMVGAVSRN